MGRSFPRNDNLITSSTCRSEERNDEESHHILSLVWFIVQNPGISTRAVEIFRKAENASVEISIPTNVLAEILYLSDKIDKMV